MTFLEWLISYAKQYPILAGMLFGLWVYSVSNLIYSMFGL